MITVPLDAIKNRIVEEAHISMDELNERIKSKLKQLSGLITEEGATQIVANELKVNLMKSEGVIKVKNLIPGMKDVEINLKVLKKYEVRSFQSEKRSGKIGKFLAGDESGNVMIVLWNDAVDDLGAVKEGDILKVTKCVIKDNNGRSEVHLNDPGSFKVNPEGVKVETTKGGVSQNTYSQIIRKKISELKENENNIEIFATIVQVFDPKFFKVDPKTNKRLPDDTKSGFNLNVVMNIFVDDGSDNIRIVLWKNQILSLLGISENDFMKFYEDPSGFERFKTDLLGMMVKFIGRTVNNEVYGRTEFIANIVNTNVDPDEEIKKLDLENKNSSFEEKKQDEKEEHRDHFQDDYNEKNFNELEDIEEDIELEEDLLSLEDLNDLD